MPSCVAFIPARAGSKRVPDKNIKLLAGHPLLAYSVCAATESAVFDKVICATDSPKYTEIARVYGAEVPFLRPGQISGDKSPDIEWVKFMLEGLRARGEDFDCFCILRPTSPFRRADTIRRAWRQFTEDNECDSLRAVELCSQHPAKMWLVEGKRMRPVLEGPARENPWHSSQYTVLPKIYVQNASLEIAWTRVVDETNTIAGFRIAPFFTEGYEGVDVNKPYDWEYAEHLVRMKEVLLPDVGGKGNSKR